MSCWIWGPRWLAIHLRGTDKLLQAPSNRVSQEQVAEQAKLLANTKGLKGALVCSDDPLLKAGVVTELQQQGLIAVTFEAQQLSSRGLACHKVP